MRSAQCLEQARAQQAPSVIQRINETKQQDGININSPFELAHASYSFPATVKPNEYCHIFARKLDMHTQLRNSNWHQQNLVI